MKIQIEKRFYFQLQKYGIKGVETLFCHVYITLVQIRGQRGLRMLVDDTSPE